MFLDESGDLGSKGSSFFVIAGLGVDDPKRLKRIISNMRRNKFKKELKIANEIKFHSSSDAIKLHMIKELNKIPSTQIYCIVLYKKDFLNDFKYYKRDRHQIYNYVAGVLAEEITLEDNTTIRIDRSKGNQFLREKFDDYFLKKLNLNTRKVEIFHSESHAWHGLQFADIIAGAYFHKFEYNNSSFVELLDINSNVKELKRK